MMFEVVLVSFLIFVFNHWAFRLTMNARHYPYFGELNPIARRLLRAGPNYFQFFHYIGALVLLPAYVFLTFKVGMPYVSMIILVLFAYDAINDSFRIKDYRSLLWRRVNG